MGDKLDVSGPLGQFSMVHHRSPKYLFLSAGSGITPLMSMTRTLHDQCDPADLIFVHNARTPRDIIFRDELEDIAARPGVQVHAICEANSPTKEWTGIGISGRLTLPTVLGIAPGSDGHGDIRLRTTGIYECGPGHTRLRGSGCCCLASRSNLPSTEVIVTAKSSRNPLISSEVEEISFQAVLSGSLAASM